MAKREKVKKFSIESFDNAHYQTTEQYTALVAKLYDIATKEITAIFSKENINTDKPFSFADYPKTLTKIQAIIQQLANNVKVSIENGSKRQWLFANKKNDAFLNTIIESSVLKKVILKKYQDHNLDALKTFQTRKVDGMNLSQRVWKYTKQYKDQIETALDVGLGEGKSAAELSKDVRENLQNPDALFRRVRDKRGQLGLSKKAQAFHPGTGKYRSAHKNAMRLTRSEINMAYREADWKRWQSMDFIIGFEIKRSNREKHCTCKLCDRLQGVYPKTFKFVGWHPQCMCYCIPILEDFFSKERKDDRVNRLRSALYGTEYKKRVSPQITEYPEEFKKWVNENAEAQKGWNSTPYFIRDNFIDGKLENGLIHQVAPKKVKTEAEKIDIQQRWNTRRASRKYSEEIDVIKKEFLSVPSINSLITKVQQSIKEGVELTRIDAMMRKLSHKAEVKKAWEERKENNHLSTLLVGVKEVKAQFGTEAVKSVFTAVESKLEQWNKQDSSLAFLKKKLSFEIKWLEDNKKYPTWKVAQDAYKKKLNEVDYLIAKQDIQQNIAASINYAQKTKSIKVKNLVAEIQQLLDKNAPISIIQNKSLSLNNEIDKLEKAKAKRELKKLLGNTTKADWSNPDTYSQKRKDNAMWAKTPKSADKKLRETCGILWQNASDEEKYALHYYTHTYSSINEPLRGVKYLGNKDVKHSQEQVPHITSMLNKCSYDFDMWLQRGVDAGLNMFNINLNGLTEVEAKSQLLGKIFQDNGFISCANTKGKGFDHKKVILNIYAPKGTKCFYLEPFSAFGKGVGKNWNGVDNQQKFGSEAEVLLQRGTKFRVTKVEYNETSAKWYIDLDVVWQI
ncbi:ADP-ribosyltransferase [Capnocytophaga canimorsus]|uniref:ADP-ribosyltransferase n=1 Tax=Capnocytophaga canimorsus TaxID=28188 RepID=UPI0037D4C641